MFGPHRQVRLASTVAVLTAALTLPGAAWASEEGWSLALHRAAAQAQDAPTYGQPGGWWVSVGGGGGVGAEDNTFDATGFVGLSTFLVQDVELNLEFAGWWFDQDGQDDSGAGNFNLLFRWHFVDRGDWTLFADAGAGVLLATDEIPDGGSEFNFTPRAGVGATVRLGNSPNRLLVGARWQHISNARLFGDSRNPGRDAAVFYAALVFPF